MADSVVSMPSPIRSSRRDIRQGRKLDRAAAFQVQEPWAGPILLPSAENAVRWMPMGSSVMMSRTSATIAGRVPIPQGQRG